MNDTQDAQLARMALTQMRHNLKKLERFVRVLIIDDDKDDCELLARLIREVNASVLVDFAHDGSQAEILCRSREYDVIFLDLVLPGPSGIDLLKCSNCFKKEAHLIVLTGLTTENMMVKEAMENGARVIFQKPMDRQQVGLIFGRIP